MTKKILKFFDITTIKFLIVGVVNTLVGTGLMFILYNVFSVNYWISSALFSEQVFYFPEQRKILETDPVFCGKYYHLLSDSLWSSETCSVLDIQRI